MTPELAAIIVAMITAIGSVVLGLINKSQKKPQHASSQPPLPMGQVVSPVVDHALERIREKDERISSLKKEVRRLRHEVEMKERVIDFLEAQLRALGQAPILPPTKQVLPNEDDLHSDD